MAHFDLYSVQQVEVEVEQGLISHKTHYRSSRGRVLRIKWPTKSGKAL